MPNDSRRRRVIDVDRTGDIIKGIIIDLAPRADARATNGGEEHGGIRRTCYADVIADVVPNNCPWLLGCKTRLSPADDVMNEVVLKNGRRVRVGRARVLI